MMEDITERIIGKINQYIIMMLNGKCKTDFRVKNEGNRSFHKQNSNPFERWKDGRTSRKNIASWPVCVKLIFNSMKINNQSYQIDNYPKKCVGTTFWWPLILYKIKKTVSQVKMRHDFLLKRIIKFRISIKIFL